MLRLTRSFSEKFFSGEKFTQDEIVKGIHKGVNEGKITPVTCVSSTTLAGVDMLLKEISLLLPAPSELDTKTAVLGDDIIEIPCRASDPLSAFVFRTIADPFVGKMSFIKIYSGKMSPNMEFVNATTGATEKLRKALYLCGKKQIEVACAEAGDIVVATKISANTSDTLCDSSRVVAFEKLEYPRPCFSMAVKAKAQGDESKISAAINRILEEDKTLSYEMNSSTLEQILTGLGEQHLEVAVSKAKSKFGADISLSVPKIAYKETIRKKVKVQGNIKSNPADMVSMVMFGLSLNLVFPTLLYLRKRFSAAQCLETSSRQLKRDFRTVC